MLLYLPAIIFHFLMKFFFQTCAIMAKNWHLKVARVAQLTSRRNSGKARFESQEATSHGLLELKFSESEISQMQL